PHRVTPPWEDLPGHPAAPAASRSLHAKLEATTRTKAGPPCPPPTTSRRRWAVPGCCSRCSPRRSCGRGSAGSSPARTPPRPLTCSDQAILEVGRLDGIPVRTEESREVSSRIARIVFDRVGPERTLTEPELNAAIAMFAKDVALVRRDAVDSGILTRSADGASYRLAPE